MGELEQREPFNKAEMETVCKSWDERLLFFKSNTERCIINDYTGTDAAAASLKKLSRKSTVMRSGGDAPMSR